MPQSVNERLADAAVGHAIDLERYGNTVVRRIIAILNRTDADLFARLMAALETMPVESFTVERLESLLYSVRALNKQAYDNVGQVLTADLRELAEYEAGYQQQLFASAIPVEVTFAAVNVDQVYTAALSRPFQGRLLSEWAQGIEANRMARIRDAVRMGYVEGQTTSQIVQRIRGTRAKGYQDGIIEIDRQHARTVVQTALSHMAEATRDRFHSANADILKAVEWLSTLDSKTSEGCRIRDGKHYTVDGHKPIGHTIPWKAGPGRLHWNCRSLSTPVVKSWKELGFAIEELPESTRASMDGQVAGDVRYADWIKRQSAARQDDVLGPSRGKLMREGGLTLDRFYTDKGKYLTLEEMRRRDAAAFGRAGL